MQTHVNAGCMMHLSFHAAAYHHLKSRTYTAAVIQPRCLYRQTFLTISDLRRFPFNKNSGLKFRKFYVPNGTIHSGCERWLLFFRLRAALFCSKICKREDFSSEVARIARAQVRNARDSATQILSLKDFRAKERLLEV